MLGPHVVAPVPSGALLLVGGDDLVERGDRVGTTPGQPGAHGVGFGPEAADVEHGP